MAPSSICVLLSKVFSPIGVILEAPGVTTVAIGEDQVRETVTWNAMYEVWTECRASSKVPLHLNYEKRRQHYFNRSKMEAKMMFFYYIGELNLRTNRRKEAERKHGGVHCLYGICCGVDSIPHIRECQGYSTKPPSDLNEENFGQYLLEVHRERVIKMAREKSLKRPREDH